MTDSSAGPARAKNLYWVSFLLGFAVVVGMAWLPLHPLVPTLGAVGVMLAYLGVSRVWTEEETKHPDFADGFYYMGFLLTLVALVITLVRIGDRTSGDLQEFVLTNFGLALATTIVGLLGRTALRMFGASADEDPTKAYEELRMASERFRTVLNDAATDMRTTLGSAQNSIDSGVQAIKAHLDAMAERLSEVERSFEPLGAKFTAVAERTDDLQDRLGRLGDASTRVRPPLEALGRSFVQLGSGAEASGQQMRALSEALEAALNVTARVEAVASSLERAFEPIRRFSNDAAALPEMEQGVAAFGASMLEGRVAIDALVASSRRAEEGLGRLAHLPRAVNVEALESLSAVLGEHVDGLGQSVQAWRQGVTDMNGLARQLHEHQKDASDALLRVQDELRASVAILATEIEGSPA